MSAACLSGEFSAPFIAATLRTGDAGQNDSSSNLSGEFSAPFIAADESVEEARRWEGILSGEFSAPFIAAAQQKGLRQTLTGLRGHGLFR